MAKPRNGSSHKLHTERYRIERNARVGGDAKVCKNPRGRVVYPEWVGKAQSAGNSDRGKCQISKALDPALTGIGTRSLNTNPKLKGGLSTCARGSHGPPANSCLVLVLNSLARAEATVFLVNALLLATRRMTSSGAMTCKIVNLSKNCGCGKGRT